MPARDFELTTSYGGVFADPEAFHEQVRLLWLGAGTGEERIHGSVAAMHEPTSVIDLTLPLHAAANAARSACVAGVPSMYLPTSDPMPEPRDTLATEP